MTATSPSHVQPKARDAIGQHVTPGTALLALGIVYGDLGTSPLYALQAIAKLNGGPLTPDTALGVLSLIFWSLIIVISIKYCIIVMKADNHGEGGIMALLTLTGAGWRGRGRILVACGLLGAALIYGDGVITPAISVLSALEGLNVATPIFEPYVMPLGAAVLIALFALQPRGTEVIGRTFGPVMALWFVTIGVLGLLGVLQHPEVLKAVDPIYAGDLLFRHGSLGFIMMGGVFLALTGGEALYADMGHIGRNPIRFSWYAIVLPALLLNYAGQIGLYLADPSVSGALLFRLAPSWLLYPLVLLATAATIIASQAIITGSFSMTRQAMQLGWLPGLKIRQTSAEKYGQIYVPTVNWAMMLLTVTLTIVFGSSERLAGAYGMAVATTMVLTTTLLYSVMRNRWRWPRLAAVPVVGLLLVVDLTFFAANLLKIVDGGWIPLTLGALIFGVMLTWRSGTTAVRRHLATRAKSPEHFAALLSNNDVRRVPGTAVFLTRSRHSIAPAIVEYALRSRSLPQNVIALTLNFETVPRVHAPDQIHAKPVADGVWQVMARLGFVEIPWLPHILARAEEIGVPSTREATYYVEHDEVTSDPHHGFWRKRQIDLFAFMFRNAAPAVDRFGIPPAHLAEIGRWIEI